MLTSWATASAATAASRHCRLASLHFFHKIGQAIGEQANVVFNEIVIQILRSLIEFAANDHGLIEVIAELGVLFHLFLRRRVARREQHEGCRTGGERQLPTRIAEAVNKGCEHADVTRAAEFSFIS